MTGIAIIGAGIAGLAMARALERRGIGATLYEAAPALGEVGAGLSIWPNGQLALHRLGLLDAFEQVSEPWTRVDLHWRTKHLTSHDLGFAQSGQPPRIAHRGRLFSVLREGVSTPIETGRRITDPAALGPDAVIFADGAGSIGRRKPVTPTIYSCFRGMAKGPHPFERGTGGEIYGPGGLRFGYFDSGPDETYWFGFVNRPAGQTRFADWRSTFAALHPIAHDLIGQTDPETILFHPIQDGPAERYQGPLTACLIGDAAHPIQPSLGQGASLALEDAVVLGALFDPADPARAFRAFEDARWKRWRAMVSNARASGFLYQTRFAPLRRMMIASYRLMSEGQSRKVVAPDIELPALTPV